jgi:hypothetical protein
MGVHDNRLNDGLMLSSTDLQERQQGKTTRLADFSCCWIIDKSARRIEFQIPSVFAIGMACFNEQ